MVGIALSWSQTQSHGGRKIRGQGFTSELVLCCLGGGFRILGSLIFAFDHISSRLEVKLPLSLVVGCRNYNLNTKCIPSSLIESVLDVRIVKASEGGFAGTKAETNQETCLTQSWLITATCEDLERISRVMQLIALEKEIPDGRAELNDYYSTLLDTAGHTLYYTANYGDGLIWRATLVYRFFFLF